MTPSHETPYEVVGVLLAILLAQQERGIGVRGRELSALGMALYSTGGKGLILGLPLLGAFWMRLSP